MTDAPGWLIAEIAEGLQRLLVLRLEGTPPADAIDGVVVAWVDAMMARPIDWQEALDAWRIREAFRYLSAHVMRWPAPAHLFEHLPGRRLPKSLPPPMNEAKRAKVREMLAGIRASMRIGGL